MAVMVAALIVAIGYAVLRPPPDARDGPVWWTPTAAECDGGRVPATAPDVPGATWRTCRLPRRRGAVTACGHRCAMIPLMAYWLSMSGSDQDPYIDGAWRERHDRWDREIGSVTMFTKGARVKPGDRLILYAVGSPRRFGRPIIFAVQEVLSEVRRSRHERWDWEAEVREVLAGPRLECCPSLEEIGKAARSVQRKSHIHLTDEEGQEAERLIARAAAQHGAQ